MRGLHNIIIIICFVFPAAGSLEAQAPREEDMDRAVKEVDRSYRKEAEKEAGLYTEGAAADIEIADRPVTEERKVPALNDE